MREVWSREEMDPGHLLRQFLLEYERLRSMPADVVRRVLYFEPQHSIPCQDQSRRGNGKRKRPATPGENDLGLGEETPIRRRLLGG